MEILNLEGERGAPKIILDKQKGIFEISGRSLVENASELYKPVLRWLKEYSTDPNPTTDFVFKLEYINTASSKLILDVLSCLEGIKGARILWCFLDEDEDMEETGEEFAELVSIPFEFRAL
jgi:hypothetical protein